MKKVLSVLLVAIMLVMPLSVGTFAVGQANNAITSSLTPTSSATLLFSKKFGVNYKAAPTPPVVVGDTLIVVSGTRLYKLNAKTGEVLASAAMQGDAIYATVSPLYADGKVFVQLDGGVVQAFDYQSFNSLWVYTDSLGGQALCPIVYDNGFVYTGFWNNETKYANYVCLNVKDENTSSSTESKSAQWTYSSLGGFYWAGCCVTDKFVVFGKDDGEKGSDGNSKIVALNKSSGSLTSSLSVKGDIRSSVTYSAETNAYYVSSKAGYIYKFNMDSSSGKLTLSKTYTACGAVTATPVIYGSRLYAGCQNGSVGKFLVLDADSMQEVYTAETLGYPQATALVSNGYEKSDGKVYVYLTYNSRPGGITVFEDSSSQTSAIGKELFTPSEDMAEYCISTISVGDDGTLYYKNDSGNIFAVNSGSDINSSINSFLGLILAFFKAILEIIKMIFA